MVPLSYIIVQNVNMVANGKRKRRLEPMRTLYWSSIGKLTVVLGTDHSQNPSAITTIKSPKEKINCAVIGFICESRNCVDE